MMKALRWRVGFGLEENQCMLFRDNRCVGMVSFPELAQEIVNVLNGAAPNDREYIIKLLTDEANRIFHKQEKDYPSNVLDAVSNSLRAHKEENLIEDPYKSKTPDKVKR